MSAQITVTRYRFSELSDEAKEKAIENEIERLYQLDTSDEITDCLTDELSQKLSGGKEIPNDLSLSWDLSWAQGSGLSFDGRLEKVRAPLLTWPEKASYALFIRTDNRYCHAYTVTPELYDIEGEEVEEGLSIFRDQYLKVCRELEEIGYDIIESLCSREAALDNLSNGSISEDYCFTSEGVYDIPKQ